jgi:hypothetical protein
MDISIQHHIAHIQQTNLTDCWAAAMAMAMHRHSAAGVQHVKNMAHAHGITPNSDGTLDTTDVPRMARAVLMHSHHFVKRDPTVDFLRRAMEAGPIVVFGLVHGIRDSQHVLVAYRMEGDGRPGHTKIFYIDPEDGRTQHTSVEDFVRLRIVTDFILARL